MKPLKAIKPGTIAAIIITTVCVWASSQALADRATRVANAIWAHDQLYDTVATDTAFKSPPPQSTDIIYSFADSGLMGQRSVAEAAPGDPDYNGGRWNVKVVVFTPMGLTIHDGDGDGVADFELTNAEQVQHHESLGHLMIIDPGVHFECPLLPRRNR